MITSKDIDKSISFKEYYQLSEKLAKEGGTSGNNPSEDLINYSKLNFSRMKRILKTIRIEEDVASYVKSIPKKLLWVALTESWCGDAAQNLPILAKMADLNPHIELQILWRDQNPEIMDQYLTNGGRSIPKVIFLDEDLNELGTWGPRPSFLQQWMKQEKEAPTMASTDLKKEFQIWYTKDKGTSLDHRFNEKLVKWRTNTFDLHYIAICTLSPKNLGFLLMIYKSITALVFAKYSRTPVLK